MLPPGISQLPRVSVLVLAGVLIAALVRYWSGHEVRDLTAGIAEPLVDIALVMVAFLLGGDLTAERWRRDRPAGDRAVARCHHHQLTVGGRRSAAFRLPAGTGLAARRHGRGHADPAAVQDVINESRPDRSAGEALRGVVAIDDAWGIIAFGLALAVLGWVTDAEGGHAIAEAGWELGAPAAAARPRHWRARRLPHRQAPARRADPDRGAGGGTS